MKRSRFMLAVLIGMILCVGLSVEAVTYFPVESGDWSNPDIWSPWGGPEGSADVACASGAWEIIVDGQQEVGTVQCGYRTGVADNYGWMTMMDSAASLNVTANLYVGYQGNTNGRFTQWAGTVNVANYLQIKYEAGTNQYSTYPGGTSWGEYALHDGALTVGGRTYVGSTGKGSFVQNGGTHTTPWLLVGVSNGVSLGDDSDVAYYTMTAGTLNITNASFGISLGLNASGRGVFNLGDADSTGTITGVGHLRLRQSDSAGDGMAIFQGWGQVGMTGNLLMGGKVIADSRSDGEVQADRDLSMSNFANVANFESPIDGMGFYAINRGRLILPNVNAEAGTSTLYWGDYAGAPCDELINTVKIDFDNVAGGSVAGSLLAVDRSDVGLAGQNIIGVWNFDGSAFDFGSGSVALSFRYDEALATQLGLTEENLKLYVKTGGSWVEVTCSVDSALNVLTVSDLTSFSMFAIGGDIVAVQIPGDANDDGMVDVGDLGILAANYGAATGATWAMGDFNGDGAVDVGDLGILAAHYGEGVSGAVDFDADYAKAFGETVVDDDSEADAGSTVCSGLGLPLVAGLLVAGLMLVKLEE